MELHVFDFDGTIFYSPSPNAALVRRLFGADMLGQLMSVPRSGGLGWFQSISSLSPPAVPAEPDMQHWYVGAVLRYMRALIVDNGTSATTMTMTMNKPPRNKHLFVLSGRDAKYAERIAHLLRHAGLYEHVTQIMLKPHETAGTVRHKLCAFLRLIHHYHPQHIYYYEDRPDQGRRILEGVRLLHRRLHPALLQHVSVRILRDDDDGAAGASTKDGPRYTTSQCVCVPGATAETTQCHGADSGMSCRGSSSSANGSSCACAGSCNNDSGMATTQNNKSSTASSSSSSTVTSSAALSPPSSWLRCLSPSLPAHHVLSDNNVAARRAQRQAEGLIDAVFAQEGHRQQHDTNKHANGTAGDVGNDVDPPPFQFTLVMMPAHVRERSAYMLNEQQLTELVQQLQHERDALRHQDTCAP